MPGLDMQIRMVLVLVFLAVGLPTMAQDNKQVQAVFRDFQAGYTSRDTLQVADFCQRLFANDIVIIGTGEDEWINGIDKARDLVKNDWAYWLNLSLDTAGIEWHRQDNTILFAVKGTASIAFKSKDQAYDFAMTLVQRSVTAEPDSKNKLLMYNQQSAWLIGEIEKGGLTLSYQIRLSGALAKANDRWIFRQLVFSFPYPMKRVP